MAVADKYNCTLNNHQLDATQIRASLDAGDNVVDAIAYQMVYFCNDFVLGGYMADLYTYDEIDLSKPWWNQSAVDELTTFDKLYMAFGDFITNHGITFTHCFFYNMNLAEDYGVTDIYDVVRNGEWTIDKLEEYSKTVYTDDGDTVRGWEDTYGLGQSAAVAGVFKTAFNHPVTVKNEEGAHELNLNTEKFADIVERMQSFCNETEGVWTVKWADEGKVLPMFTNDQLLFYNGFLCDSAGLREMESDYGILPFPKWDEAQDSYHTPVRGDNYLMGIPYTVGGDDVEFVGNCTEMLAYYGYTIARPAVYDITLKEKVARDENAKEMLDLVCSNITVEWEFCHTSNQAFEFVLVWMIQDNLEWSSYYKSKETAAIRYYEQVLDSYRDLLG